MVDVYESANAAGDTIDEFELAEPDTPLSYALMDDEAFTVACYHYQSVDVYADHEDATQADKDARDALERSVREHAQRVQLAEVDADA